MFGKNSYQRHGIKIEPGSRWLDLGANVGSFSVLASALGARCDGFEADAANAMLANRNMQRNGAAGSIRHVAVVADSFRGDRVRLFFCTEPGSQWRHSIANQRRKSTPIVVPTVRFSALQELGADCMKMDIEGAEFSILHDRPSLSWLRILVLEWHFDTDPRIRTLQRAMEYLSRYFNVVRASQSTRHGMWKKESCDFFPPATYVYAHRCPT